MATFDDAVSIRPCFKIDEGQMVACKSSTLSTTEWRLAQGPRAGESLGNSPGSVDG